MLSACKILVKMKRIRLLRTLRGISQQDLGKRAGLSQQFISFIESGKNRPSKESIKKLEKALDADLGNLFND